MPLQVTVTLVNGGTHRVSLDFDDPADVANVLRQHGEPFNQEWIQAADGTLVRLSAIVSVAIAESGSEKVDSL